MRKSITLLWNQNLELLWDNWSSYSKGLQKENHIIEDDIIIIKNLEINSSYSSIRYNGKKNLRFMNVRFINSLTVSGSSLSMNFENCEIDYLTVKRLENVMISNSIIKRLHISRLENCFLEIDESRRDFKALERLTINNINELDVKVKNTSPEKVEIESCSNTSLLLQNLKSEELRINGCKFKKASFSNVISELRVNNSNFESLNLYRLSGFLGIYDSTIAKGKLNQCPKSNIVFNNNNIQNEFVISNNRKLEIRNQEFEKIKLLNNHGSVKINKPRHYPTLDLKSNQFTEITLERIEDEAQHWSIIPSADASLEIKDFHIKNGDLTIKSKNLIGLNLYNSSCKGLKLDINQVNDLQLEEIRVDSFFLKAKGFAEANISYITAIDEKSNFFIEVRDFSRLLLKSIDQFSQTEINSNNGDFGAVGLDTKHLKINGKNLRSFILSHSNFNQIDFNSDVVDEFKIESTTSKTQESISSIYIGESQSIEIDGLEMSNQLRMETGHCEKLHISDSQFHSLVTHIDSGSISFLDSNYDNLNLNGRNLELLNIQNSRVSKTEIDFDSVSSVWLSSVFPLDENDESLQTIRIKQCERALFRKLQTKGHLEIIIESGNKLLVGQCALSSVHLDVDDFNQTSLIHSEIGNVTISGHSDALKISDIKPHIDEYESEFKITINKAQNTILKNSKVTTIAIEATDSQHLIVDSNSLEQLSLTGDIKKVEVSSNLEKDWTCNIENLVSQNLEFYNSALLALDISSGTKIQTLILNRIQLKSEISALRLEQEGNVTRSLEEKSNRVIKSLRVFESTISSLSTSECSVSELVVENTEIPQLQVLVSNLSFPKRSPVKNLWYLTFVNRIKATFIKSSIEQFQLYGEEKFLGSKLTLQENCKIDGELLIENLEEIKLNCSNTEIEEIRATDSFVDSTFHDTIINKVLFNKLSNSTTIKLTETSISDLTIKESHIGTFDWLKENSKPIKSIKVDDSSIGSCHIESIACETLNFINSRTPGFNLKDLQTHNLKLQNFEFTGNGEGAHKFQMNFINTSLNQADQLSFLNTDLSQLKMNSCYFETFKSLEVASSKLDEISCTATTWPKKVVSYKADNPKKLHFFEIRETCRQLKMAMANHHDKVSELQFHALEMDAYRHIVLGNWNWKKPTKQFGDILSLVGGWTNGFGLKWLRPIGLLALVISCIYLWFLCSYYDQSPNWELVDAHWNWDDFTSFLNPTHRLSQLTLERPFPRSAVIADFLSKIFSAFFIYQIVVAFRKFRK